MAGECWYVSGEHRARIGEQEFAILDFFLNGRKKMKN